MTLGQPTFQFEGIGIHTGERTSIEVELLPESNQVTFISPLGEILASPNTLSDSCNRSTDITRNLAKVQTVEHLLFALGVFSLGANVFINGPEVPILDGSALPFITECKKKGFVPKGRYCEVTTPQELTIEESVAQIIPCAKSESPVYTVALQFQHPGIGHMTYSFSPDETDPAVELAPARTFALESEVRHLLRQRKGLGGSLDNALVIGENGPLNPGGMRFPNEPARHKMLDLLGDLSLLGALPFAHIRITRPGHAINHKIVKSLWQDRDMK